VSQKKPIFLTKEKSRLTWQVLHGAAVCRSVLQRAAETFLPDKRDIPFDLAGVAVCCSVLQCAAGPYLPDKRDLPLNLAGVAVCCNVLQNPIFLTKETYQLTMGWLRLVGSLKLLVSFAENGLFYRDLLQKRPII